MKTATKTIAYHRKTASQRKQDLIQAGIKCLRKGGLPGFTIDQICRQAGVSRGLINHHFKTKEELLVNIYAEMTRHLATESTAGNAAQELVDVVEASFDEASFNRANLRAWLSIWAEVANNEALNALHKARYQGYKQRIESALHRLAAESQLNLDFDSVSRQLIALIDGLWLEYCLHAEGFTLAAAKTDCYRFLQALGLDLPGGIGPDDA